MPVWSKNVRRAVESNFQKYCVWLARNPKFSKELELGIKLSSYLLVHLVDKGGSSDAAHQIIYCMSDLISFLNDFAISRAYPQWSLPYGNNLKTWLTVLEYCEVCFELGSHQVWGNRGRWMTVVMIQVFKCFARIMLVRRNEGLLPFPPIVPLRREAVGDYNFEDERTNMTYKLGSGVVIRKLDSGPSFNQLSQIHGDDFRSLMRQSSGYTFKGATLLGETIFALKPLIHLGAMQFTGRNGWTQWLTSLVLECVSLRLQWDDYTKKYFSEDQQYQYISRIVSLLVYLVRSPFYDRNVKRILLSVLYALKRIFPFLKFVIGPAIEFLPAWHETYFYLWSH